MPKDDGLLQVGFYIFFPGGGIGRYTHRLGTVLGQRPGVQVELMCSPDYKWTQADGYRTWEGLASLSHEIPTLRRWRFLKGQFVNPRRAIAHARATGVDVMHFANINHLTFPYWRRALHGSGISVVASAHDVRRGKAILNRRWEDHQLQAFYRFADALFVHSDYQAQELAAFADVSTEKVYVVPHGPYTHGEVEASQVDLRAKWGLPVDERPVALFFGKLRDDKNLDGLIRALGGMERPPHLVVAGREDDRHRGFEFYRTLAQKVDVGPHITFLPRFIEDQEVAELFGAADWAALPYKETFTSQSGVLNVAAHYECPVLVSSAPVLRETVQKSNIGVVCRGDGPAALAEGIDRLHQRIETGQPYTLAGHHPHDDGWEEEAFAESQHQERWGEEAFAEDRPENRLEKQAFAEYRDQYSWEENASRTLTVYRQLVS
jgi:glycosyltransferase involved in cell wall biosynthesis